MATKVVMSEEEVNRIADELNTSCIITIEAVEEELSIHSSIIEDLSKCTSPLTSVSEEETSESVIDVQQ